MHAMCAYLGGVSFRVRREVGGRPYEIGVSCCQGDQLQRRLSVQRQWKLNYEKLIFREEKNEEIYEYIISQMASR